MARLEYHLREATAEGYPPATLVELSGSVDPDTLEIFEGIMDQLSDAGKSRIVFDMHKLKYINSTGMGMLVQFADTLREEGGGLVLMRMQPKVLLVVEMLGLQELFQIVTSESEALVALAGEEVGPSSIQVHLEEEEAEAVPEAVPIIEEAEPAPEAVPIEGAVQCPVCSVSLVMPVAGTYRCPRCRSAIQVDAEGQAEGYPEPADQITEMSVPARGEYFEGVERMLSLAGRQSGFDDSASGAAAASAAGCLKLLSETVLNGNAFDRRLHLFVRPDSGHLTIRIYCGGSALTSKSVLDPFRDGVDRLDYMASPQGNLVTLEKRA